MENRAIEAQAWGRQMDPKQNLILAAAIAAILGVHGAAPAPACISVGQKYACPEPEQTPADMPESQHQIPPTFYGVQSAVLSTATGPVTITPNTGAMNFVSGAPQVFENPAPVIFPTRPKA